MIIFLRIFLILDMKSRDEFTDRDDSLQQVVVVIKHPYESVNQAVTLIQRNGDVLRHPNVCAHRCVFLLGPFMDLFETTAFVAPDASKHVEAFPLRTIEPFEYCCFSSLLTR